MPDINLMNCLAALVFSFIIGFGWTTGSILAGWLWRRRSAA